MKALEGNTDGIASLQTTVEGRAALRSVRSLTGRRCTPTLPGMEEAEMKREEARGLMERMELEERLRTVKADISAKAGDMEYNIPLFHGTGSNPSLF